MKTYFSTFVTGTQEVIKTFLSKRDANIELLLDGLVVYRTDYPVREVRNFRIFNNTYILLQQFEGLSSDVDSVEKILSDMAKQDSLPNEISANLPTHRRDFKIVPSLKNQMVSVNRQLLEDLESVIRQADSELELNVGNPDLEFWALVRDEGYGFFGIRLTYPYGEEKNRKKGELRKEIAHIMCYISDPSPEDVVLDPFAGHGAIPLERAQSFPRKKIMAVEKDKKLVTNLRQQAEKHDKDIKVIHGDALSMTEIENKSISRIISDPPWGEYEEIPEPNKFYKKMLKEFNRVLETNGVIVLLMGAKEKFEDVLNDQFANVFSLESKYDILVSGNKASIYKMVKNE